MLERGSYAKIVNVVVSSDASSHIHSFPIDTSNAARSSDRVSGSFLSSKLHANQIIRCFLFFPSKKNRCFLFPASDLHAHGFPDSIPDQGS